jgi:glycosyltransferase involved in cell wall biosynthesis
VMVEALACGTPVLALRAGSVPEVIEHGQTGFVADTEEALVQAIAHIDSLDRGRCRRAAETRFSVAAMVDQYERVYESLTPNQRSAVCKGVA